jgi:hypothetical protein
MNDMTKVPTEFDYRLAVLHKLVEMKPIVDKALAHSHEGHSFKDAFELIASNRGMFFWLGSSFAILEYRQFPSGLVLHCLWSGGVYKELLELYESVAAFGLKNGVKYMTTLGREGFRRRLPHEGWKIVGTWFVKELEERV